MLLPINWTFQKQRKNKRECYGLQLYPYIQSTVPVSDGGWLGVNISFLDHKHILAVSLVHEIFSINYQIHAK